MSYATVQDFVDYFGSQESVELSNLDDPTAETVDEVLIARSLDHAHAEVNSYLAGNYTLPLTATVPQILKYDEIEIARFRMDKYRTREDVTERYQLVIQRLRDISKGIVNLGLDQNDKEVEVVAGDPDYVSAPPVFTLESLNGF